MSDPPSACPYCDRTPVKRWFCTRNWACFRCKLAQSQANMEDPAEQRKWSECAPDGQPHLACMLKHLVGTERERLPQLFGAALWDANRNHFEALLTFAGEEKRSYGFRSDPDFTLVRFERAMEAHPGTADFWLTLCVAFDMDNYFDDLNRKE